MTSQLWTVYDVACPFCGAGFGARCTVVRRNRVYDPPKTRVSPHEERRLAYRKARAGRPSGR